jgi:hypothetical protein
MKPKGSIEFSLTGTIREGIEIEIDKVEIHRYLGYEEEQSLRVGVSSLVDDQICRAYEFVKPAAYYTIKPITSVGNSRISVDGLLFTSHNLARVFSGCSQAAIFVVTIGGALESEVAQLTKEGLLVRASVLDAVGSVAVEKVADWLEGMIRNIATANGDKVGWRYSPGYCDWDITQQRELFRGLDSESIGVHLTDTCLMVPRKSMSGIISMGKFCSSFSACHFCKRDCPNRREEFSPNG